MLKIFPATYIALGIIPSFGITKCKEVIVRTLFVLNSLGLARHTSVVLRVRRLLGLWLSPRVVKA